MSNSTFVETASVKSLWQQWTVIVDLFARGDIARRRVKAEDYRALHARLLETCQANTDAKVANFARRVAEIAGPWMTTESLNEAPAKILEDLHRSCRLAEGKSVGLGRPSASQRWLSWAVFIALFVGAGLATLTVLEPSSGAGWKASVLDRLSQVEQTRKTSLMTNDGKLAFWVMAVAGGTVTAIMAYCVFRSPKQT